eukprot:143352_1
MFVSTDNPSTNINPYLIYHTPYPIDQLQAKKQIIHDKLRLTKISFMKTFLIILCFILITIVGLWGSRYFYVELATYNIKGDCIVVSNSLCSYVLKTSTDSLPICDKRHNSDHTFNIESCDDYEYEINEIIPCYTNAKCDELFMEEGTEPVYIFVGILINIAAVCIMIIAMYCMYAAWIICHCHVNYKPVYVIMEYVEKWLDMVWPVSHRYDKWEEQRLMNGKEKQLYNVREWGKLTDLQKVDYFFGYCTRKYNLNLYENIADILLEYMHMKNKRQSSQTHTVNQQPMLSKRQQYLHNTMRKQYDLH